MSMSERDIDILLKRMDKLEEMNEHRFERVYDKLDAAATSGSEISRQNAELLKTHAEKIELHDNYIKRQAGQVAMIGGSASILTVIAVKIGSFLLARVQ